MQEVWYTFSKATPRAAVNQLHQYTRHVVGAQHAVDNTDAVKKGKKYSINRKPICLFDVIIDKSIFKQNDQTFPDSSLSNGSFPPPRFGLFEDDNLG